MKRRLQRVARRLWAGDWGWRGAVLSGLLAPLSWLWRLATALRNRRFDMGGGEEVEGVRIVSVGNLAVGGTGKTPFASWVATRLAEGRARPAIVLRGYGRDEVLLHRAWTPDVPVFAGRDRPAAVREARRAGAEVVVLDDGFQHRRLARALDLVLLAVEDPLHGALLPRGPYREPLTSLRRATAVILTRRTATRDEARAFASKLAGVDGVPRSIVAGCAHLATHERRTLVEGRAAVRPTPLRSPLVLTSVGRPAAFRDAVARMSEGAVDLVDYPDHHDFTRREARAARARAGDRPIVVTEKDAVKLSAYSDLLGEVWVVGQRLVWDWGEEAILALLRGVCEGSPTPDTRPPDAVGP